MRAGVVGSVVLLLASATALVPAAPAGSQGSSCRGSDGTPTLPPGRHDVALHAVVDGSGGGPFGGFELTVTYTGDVELVVGDDGRVREATAAVAVAFDGAITGIPGVAGDLTGQGSARLGLAGATSTEVRLAGRVEGLGQLDLSGVLGERFAAEGAEGEALVLQLDRVACDQVSGTATSQLLTSTVAALEEAGLGVSSEPMAWSVGDATSPEAAEIRAELEAIEQLGTSGPDRRFASARLARALGRIKALPEPLQSCLFDAWRETVRVVLQRRIDADIAVVEGIQPTSADLGPLTGAVATLLDSEKQYALLGLDACSERDRRPAFEAIGAALRRHLDAAIEAGRVADVLRLSRDFHLFGDVSPALAAEVDDMLREHVRDWVRTTTTNLRRRADAARSAGDRDCDVSDASTVRNTVAAARTAAFLDVADVPLDEIVRHADDLGCTA